VTTYWDLKLRLFESPSRVFTLQHGEIAVLLVLRNFQEGKSVIIRKMNPGEEVKQIGLLPVTKVGIQPYKHFHLELSEESPAELLRFDIVTGNSIELLLFDLHLGMNNYFMAAYNKYFVIGNPKKNHLIVNLDGANDYLVTIQLAGVIQYRFTISFGSICGDLIRTMHDKAKSASGLMRTNEIYQSSEADLSLYELFVYHLIDEDGESSGH
jgi:hypothetical protein